MMLATEMLQTKLYIMYTAAVTCHIITNFHYHVPANLCPDPDKVHSGAIQLT